MVIEKLIQEKTEQVVGPLTNSWCFNAIMYLNNNNNNQNPIILSMVHSLFGSSVVSLFVSYRTSISI